MQKLIVGPIYIKDNAKHSYKEEPKPDHLKQVKLMGPIYQKDGTRHHFQAIEEHLETLKELHAPIYNTKEGKNQFHAILDHVEALKSLKAPVYDFGEIGHRFEGDQNLIPPATEQKNLHGPCYQIDNEHHFSEIIKQATHLRDLAGPIFDIGENTHSFRELTKNVDALRTLKVPIFMDERHQYGEKDGFQADPLQKLIVGPIYIKDNANHSYKEEPKPDHLKQVKLMGPIYQNDDTRHHFQAIQEHIETLKELKGPIYDVERKTHFNGIIEHVESIKSFQGPIYRFGEVGHKFEGEQILQPSATDTKTLHGPKYHIDNEHHFSEIISKVDQLKELAGPVYDVGETAHHFRELDKHVTSLRTLMGPIFVDEGGHR